MEHDVERNMANGRNSVGDARLVSLNSSRVRVKSRSRSGRRIVAIEKQEETGASFIPGGT